MDLDQLVAVDMHVHAMASANPPEEDEETRKRRERFAEHFGGAETQTTTQDAADYYRLARIAAVIFPVDNRSGTGELPVPNEEVAEVAADNADILIPFASVDPWSGQMGVKDIRRLVEKHGVKGFKFHPCTQAFFPNDRRVYPLYEAIESYGLPSIFHSGQAGMGAGMPGGDGIRLKYSNPLHLDDVAADFPDMPLIIAHPSFPWQDEALAIAVHKQQVYLELSGWSPKYFPPQLVHYANTLLKDKVLFGSDYPVIKPERWIADFERAGFRDEVMPLILKDNAVRLLGLSK
jgi:predicted TIM-barrel fold metal-dependent hydrolase